MYLRTNMIRYLMLYAVNVLKTRDKRSVTEVGRAALQGITKYIGEVIIAKNQTRTTSIGIT